jgi:uncharacterized phiE125 gp8 family phage protein
MKIKYSKVITPPATEPIGRDDIAKLDLKLDEITTEDDLLDILIQASRELVEERTQRSLITQTRELKFEMFPCGNTISIPNGPVQADSIVITYYDEDDTEQTLDENDYWVDVHSDVARVVIKNYWPAVKDRPNAVTITYDAGYGDTPADVPAQLKKAMLFILGHLYENRQQVTIGSIVTEIPFTAEALMSTYVIDHYAVQ